MVIEECSQLVLLHILKLGKILETSNDGVLQHGLMLVIEDVVESFEEPQTGYLQLVAMHPGYEGVNSKCKCFVELFAL